MLLEISLIQKFILLLHHPLYAVTTILSAILISAGMGSRWSQQFDSPKSRSTGIRYSAAAIIFIGVLFLLVLNPMIKGLTTFSLAAKFLFAGLLVSPLGFFMGVPFPLGLSKRRQITVAGTLGMGNKRVCVSNQRHPSHGISDPVRIYIPNYHIAYARCNCGSNLSSALDDPNGQKIASNTTDKPDRLDFPNMLMNYRDLSFDDHKLEFNQNCSRYAIVSSERTG